MLNTTVLARPPPLVMIHWIAYARPTVAICSPVWQLFSRRRKAVFSCFGVTRRISLFALRQVRGVHHAVVKLTPLLLSPVKLALPNKLAAPLSLAELSS